MSAGPGCVLVLGGGSDIGLAIARRFAAEGWGVQLAARRPEALEEERADIALRHGVEVTLHRYDACDLEAAEGFFDGLDPFPRVVVSAVGWMGEQAEVAADPALARRTSESNFLGPSWALEVAARRLAALGGPGAVIGISSVAGDRGRAKNGWYGAAKAAFSAHLSALRQTHARTEVQVITVKPGFVATRMTEGMDLPGPLTADPAELGEAVFRAWARKRSTIYVRRIWWLVMMVICALPEPVFKRLKF